MIKILCRQNESDYRTKVSENAGGGGLTGLKVKSVRGKGLRGWASD